jgi:hypothetical protein
MWQGDRVADQEFRPAEKLYLRVWRSQLAGRVPAAAAMPMPSFSVNRDAFSEPEDVLIPSCNSERAHYSGAGVVSFFVRAVLDARALSPSGQAWSCTAVHEPCFDNYAHSQVHALLERQRVESEPDRIVKRTLRLCMVENLVVEIQPLH